MIPGSAADGVFGSYMRARQAARRLRPDAISTGRGELGVSQTALAVVFLRDVEENHARGEKSKTDDDEQGPDAVKSFPALAKKLPFRWRGI